MRVKALSVSVSWDLFLREILACVVTFRDTGHKFVGETLQSASDAD